MNIVYNGSKSYGCMESLFLNTGKLKDNIKNNDLYIPNDGDTIII